MESRRISLWDNENGLVWDRGRHLVGAPHPQWDLIVGLGECSERYRPIGIFTFRALWFGASNMVYSLHVPILRELNVPSYCAKVRVNWDVYMLFGCMLPHSRTVLGMCENLFRWPHS